MYVTTTTEGDDAASKVKMTFYCRCCGNKDDSGNDDSRSILVFQDTKVDASSAPSRRINVASDARMYTQYMSKYIKFDPCLPRVKDIECPNGSKCKRPKGADNEVIYIKYDPTNLRYMYVCTHCDHFWV